MSPSASNATFQSAPRRVSATSLSPYTSKAILLATTALPSMVLRSVTAAHVAHHRRRGTAPPASPPDRAPAAGDAGPAHRVEAALFVRGQALDRQRRGDERPEGRLFFFKQKTAYEILA